MWTKTADEIPEEQKEQDFTPDEARQRELAYALSEALENMVGGDWLSLIESLSLNPQEEQWVHDNLRWTIIDENTGEDLLHSEGH